MFSKKWTIEFTRTLECMGEYDKSPPTDIKTFRVEFEILDSGRIMVMMNPGHPGQSLINMKGTFTSRNDLQVDDIYGTSSNPLLKLGSARIPRASGIQIIVLGLHHRGNRKPLS